MSKTCTDRYEQLFLLLEKKFQTANDKYNQLEKAIQKEREERPKQIEQSIVPLVQRIESIFYSKLIDPLNLFLRFPKGKSSEAFLSFTENFITNNNYT